MKKWRLWRPVLLAVFFVFILTPFIFFKNTFKSASVRDFPERPVLPYAEIKRPSQVGEKVVYDVRMGRLFLGRSVFVVLNDEFIDKKKCNVARFDTKLVNFSDTEKIYSDQETFLPLRVERLVDIWPAKEIITEDYDQKNFRLVVNKTKGKNKEPPLLIQKSGAINNAILLPFYLRNTAKIEIGCSFKVFLPTKEFEIKLVSKEEVVVPAGKFIAYKFESDPKRFEIWISDDSLRIPLKIKGSSGLGYVMEMREYHRAPQQQ